MKRKFGPAKFHSALAALFLLLAGSLICGVAGSGPASAQSAGDTLSRIDAVMPWVEMRLEPGALEGVDEFLAENADADPEWTLGQAMLLQRHINPAAWFMGRAAARSPQDPAVLSSFGAVVAESWTANPGDRDLVALDNAMALLETARDMNPQSAALQSNFGYGLLRRWQADPEGVDLAAAVDALRRATELAPDQPLFFSHLAEALLAAGDYAAAAAALTAAHRLDPVDASYLTARGSWPPEGAGALADAERNYCSVDYRCGEICPRSIIGQINRVTCEMAGSSAQIACQAGEPYAPAYNCDEEIPEYGILIPGLNSGFSIVTPCCRIDVLVQGDGRVEFRAQISTAPGAVRGNLTASGSWEPQGGVSISEVAPGVTVRTHNRGGALGEAGKYGLDPTTIRLQAPDGRPGGSDVSGSTLPGFMRSPVLM